MFSRAGRQLHVIPRRPSVTCFPALAVSSLFSRACRQLFLTALAVSSFFPRLPKVTWPMFLHLLPVLSFPALTNGYALTLKNIPLINLKVLRQESRYTYLGKGGKRSRNSVLLFLSSFDKLASKISRFSIIPQVRLDVVVNLKKNKIK